MASRYKPSRSFTDGIEAGESKLIYSFIADEVDPDECYKEGDTPIRLLDRFYITSLPTNPVFKLKFGIHADPESGQIYDPVSGILIKIVDDSNQLLYYKVIHNIEKWQKAYEDDIITDLPVVGPIYELNKDIMNPDSEHKYSTPISINISLDWYIKDITMSVMWFGEDRTITEKGEIFDYLLDFTLEQPNPIKTNQSIILDKSIVPLKWQGKYIAPLTTVDQVLVSVDTEGNTENLSELLGLDDDSSADEKIANIKAKSAVKADYASNIIGASDADTISGTDLIKFKTDTEARLNTFIPQTSDGTTIKKIVKLKKSAYDALNKKEDTTLYLVTSD